MAQFTRYSSSDAGAPQLSGTVGSLIAVLDACLVDGYGSQTAAGWTHPVVTAGNCASYQQGAGAGFCLQVNDNGPNVTSSYKEAWITGWKTIATVTAPVGTGTGQFPTAAQSLTTGHLVVLKSFTLDSVPRPWVLYADDQTFYLLVRTGSGSAGMELREIAFGSFYSHYATDANNCLIVGRTTENDTQGTQRGGLDHMNTPAFLGGLGCYFADNQAGSAGSMPAYRAGDTSKVSTVRSTSVGAPCVGNLTTPNAANNSLYLAPFLLFEASWNIRGRFRGLVHLCHPLADVMDGTIITGANAFAGRTYQVHNPGCSAGHVVVETSDTLDTN